MHSGMLTRKANGNRSWLFLSVAIMILAIFAYYFLVVVKSKENQLIRKAYRTLSNVDRNIHEKETNYDRSITQIGFCRMVNDGYLNPEIKSVFANVSESSFLSHHSPIYKDPKNGRAYYFKQYPADSVQNGKKSMCGKAGYAMYGGKIGIEDFMDNVKYDDFFSSIALFDTTQTYYSSGTQNYRLHDLDTIRRLLAKNPGAFKIEIQLHEPALRCVYPAHGTGLPLILSGRPRP